MNFELDDQQSQLKDSVRRLLADQGRFEQRRATARSERGYSTVLWNSLAGLGLTGLTVAETHGGYGGGAVDRLPVMQAFGRALLLEPYLPSCVLAATALAEAGDATQQRSLLPGVSSGEVILAWAHDEVEARHASHWIGTRATPHGDGCWRLDGAKVNVLHGGSAQHLVVSARIDDGTPDDAAGVALFLLARDTPGLSIRAHKLIDDTPAAELTLTAATAHPLGDPRDGSRQRAALQATLDAGIAAVCADMLGAMETAFELAVGYLGTRQQFGRRIGENQALRHKAAEMLVSLEVCRSMAMAAAIAADRPGDEQSADDLARAKLMLGRHGRMLCQHAIQVHGGIGMTEEYAVGHALRRVHVLDQLFGDSGAQAERLAQRHTACAA